MNRAFTLVEVMIVVAVIAILVGIALPGITGVRQSGNIAKAKSELVALKSALESYYLIAGAYPGSLGDLTSAVPNVIGTTLPEDPFDAGNNYGYNVSSSGLYFVIWSVGTGGSASASVNDSGDVSESIGSCIFVSNGERDTSP